MTPDSGVTTALISQCHLSHQVCPNQEESLAQATEDLASSSPNHHREEIHYLQPPPPFVHLLLE